MDGVEDPGLVSGLLNMGVAVKDGLTVSVDGEILKTDSVVDMKTVADGVGNKICGDMDTTVKVKEGAASP
jgi:hypothetical protein